MSGRAADVNNKVRATRAYLAGFGTSGSLLAGAALVFVLASAIVAFRGWPQVTAPSPVVNVSAPRLAVAATSRAGRILDAALRSAATGGASVAPRAARSTHGGSGSRGGAGKTSGSRSPVRTTSASPGHATVTTKPPSTCVLPACTSTPTVPPPVNTVTGTVTQTLSDSSSQLSSTVNNVTSTVTQQVPPVGSAVNSVPPTTSTAANTVTTTASGVVGGLTK